MTQQTETVQAVQSFEELKSLTRKNLLELVKQFKAEDTDCLPMVNGKSKNDDLIEALANYMGFTNPIGLVSDNNEDSTAGLFTFGDDAHLTPALTDSDVMEFGEGVPTLQTKLFDDPIIEQIMEEEGVTQPEAEEINAENLADMAEQDANWAKQIESQLPTDPATTESTGDSDVDALLADLGLDGINVIDLDGKSFDTPPENAPQNAPLLHANVQNNENAPQNAPLPPAEDASEPAKPKNKRSTLSFDDRKYTPIRKYRQYTLGMFGDILIKLDEPNKYGYNYEVLKLERFNAKAHEIFRKTKGHMQLVYTNIGSTYMIVYKQPDGTIEPVLEVTNKGRGHLQSRQLANAMQVAYNEKNDQETISAEEYQKLVEQIELLPINAESAGA